MNFLPIPRMNNHDVVVRGFLKGFGKNIRDACEEKLYQDLEHVRFGYLRRGVARGIYGGDQAPLPPRRPGD